MDELIILENKSIILKGEPRKVLYQLRKKTPLVPNQIVRFIQELEELEVKKQESQRKKFNHFITAEEVGGER